jgi:hypothetical protein
MRRGATPPLHAVETFMLALTAAKEGMYDHLIYVDVLNLSPKMDALSSA